MTLKYHDSAPLILVNALYSSKVTCRDSTIYRYRIVNLRDQTVQLHYQSSLGDL